MAGTRRRGPVVGAFVLVRRYLPSAVVVAGVVALLNLAPTLRTSSPAPALRPPVHFPSAGTGSTATATTSTVADAGTSTSPAR
ncbi:MAG TPA: hypothetical protein VMV22_05780 [Acidimicrobiales bacterium]|nr:hypothetical protein [Acidimicrobiales bacterium]